MLAVAGILLSALRSSIGALSVTVLIGTIAGVLDLQARRELTIIQATGRSIWQVARAPVAVAFLAAILISTLGDTALIVASRLLPGQPINGDNGPTWLEQRGKDGDYVLKAERVTSDPPAVYDVTIFFSRSDGRARIEAPEGRLRAGKWLLPRATRYQLDRPPESLDNFEVATQTTLGDLRLRTTGASDLTIAEMLAAATSPISMNDYRAVSLTSLFRTLMRPIMVVGSMLIGFATASGYRRNVQYGNTVLFGIVLGFALFTINEMAVRAGNADVLPPLWAMAAPAFVSVIAGLTALLYSQDGTLRRR
jgi:lipopolysaccharide export system permease protein